MSKIELNFPELKINNVWKDYRDKYQGGYGWRGDRSLDKVKYIAIHHTAGIKTRNADKDIAIIASKHINERKWGGLGYNIVITSEEINGFAKVAYVGDAGSIRTHTPNMKGSLDIPARQGNVYLLSICIVGNFIDQIPSDAQLRSTHRVCSDLIFKDKRFSSLKDWNNLEEHKTFDVTDCPGDFGAFKDKIINPPKIKEPTTSEYEKLLIDAKKWNDLVGQKYGDQIMDRVDDTQISRNDLLITLYKYTQYLRKSQKS